MLLSKIFLACQNIIFKRKHDHFVNLFKICLVWIKPKILQSRCEPNSFENELKNCCSYILNLVIWVNFSPTKKGWGDCLCGSDIIWLRPNDYKFNNTVVSLIKMCFQELKIWQYNSDNFDLLHILKSLCKYKGKWIPKLRAM